MTIESLFYDENLPNHNPRSRFFTINKAGGKVLDRNLRYVDGPAVDANMLKQPTAVAASNRFTSKKRFKGCMSNYYYRNSPHLHGNMPAPWNDDPLPEHLLQENLHDTDSLEVAYTHYG